MRQRTRESKPIGRFLRRRFGPGHESPDHRSGGSDEEEVERGEIDAVNNGDVGDVAFEL